jgi:hypothetical protein
MLPISQGSNGQIVGPERRVILGNVLGNVPGVFTDEASPRILPV